MKFQLKIDLKGEAIRSASDLASALNAVEHEVYLAFCSAPFGPTTPAPIRANGHHVGSWSIQEDAR